MSQLLDHGIGTKNKIFSSITVAAIGIVFGDIGTSPIYTMKEAFSSSHGMVPNEVNILGMLSLIFWAMVIVVSFKYATLIMRADNKGEGGVMALIALVLRIFTAPTRGRWLLMTIGIFGVALFYSDGVITPAISVLSAVEGLKVAAPSLEPYVIPITIGVLVGLFMFQRKGTAAVGALFGPITCIWFSVLGVLGVINILENPQVLKALSPMYASNFFFSNGWAGLFILGSVTLALTGAEVLYADMGHFGRNVIRRAWFIVVFPALILNYFGQGALILLDVENVYSPFFLMAPSWALYPLVVLATAATVIASQATISGTFSITRQAIQLGYSPRLRILYTSPEKVGQIYLPIINWILLIAVVSLVLGFKSSSGLASAYGVSVTGTMVVTTILAFFVARYHWKWPIWLVITVMGFLITVDLAFFIANLSKVATGGWLPLLLAVFLFTLLSTWKKGREILLDRLRTDSVALQPFLNGLSNSSPIRVPGSAVFLTADIDAVPHSLLHNLVHNKVLHERIILLTVLIKDVPWVERSERITVERYSHNFFRILIHYGFKQDPDVPRALEECKNQGIDFNIMETSFFLSRETLIPTKLPGMAMWREKVFIAMARNASSAMNFFAIPTNRVIELGTQVEL